MMINTSKPLNFCIKQENKATFVDFKTTFAGFPKTIAREKHWQNQDKKLVEIGQKITQLANLPAISCQDPQLSYQYQKYLYQLCRPLIAKYREYNDKQVLNVVIKRGAILINAYFPINKNQVLSVIGKRVKNQNFLGVRFSDWQMPKNISQYKILSIQEDCIATGDTIAGLLLVLQQKGLLFDKIIVNCPVATQQGVQFLEKNFKNLQLNISLYAYQLNNDFYIMRDNNRFFVGDMGEWSKISPKSYNKKAFWNKKRLDY